MEYDAFVQSWPRKASIRGPEPRRGLFARDEATFLARLTVNAE
jgi:hypothetical protein